jgi:hypothetical protein
MEHEMILLDADFKTVLARQAQKFNAGVSQVEVSVPRKDECGVSTTSACSSFEEDDRVVE